MSGCIFDDAFMVSKSDDVAMTDDVVGGYEDCLGLVGFGRNQWS